MAQPKETARLKDVEATAKQVLGEDAEALMAQIDTLKSDLASITEMLGEIGVRRTDETVSAAKARIEAAKREGEHLYENARDRAEQAQDQALEAIRRQPATAIGIAVGLGFLVGFLTSRK